MHPAPSQASETFWALREQQLLAPYAMHSVESEGRSHDEAQHSYRGPFQRDRDRILHSAAFRRLSGKMQVFTGDMGDYHRTRLTHTQEVASLARTIGRALRLNEDLIEALALLHDIGHPPYGHCGEDVLNECLQGQGGFSHNQFALDLVTRIEQRYTTYPGLNLTLEVLAGQRYRSHKRGSESQMLEIQVVDAADSIAYDAHDVDDALKLGLLDWDDLSGLALVERARQAVPLDRTEPNLRRQLLVHTLLDLQMSDFLDCSRGLLELHGQLTSREMRSQGIALSMHPGYEGEKRELEDFLFERVYRHPRLIDVRQRAAARLKRLFELLRARPERLPSRFEARIPEWGIERCIAVYLAGMTDRFCDDQYRALVDLSVPQGTDWS